MRGSHVTRCRTAGGRRFALPLALLLLLKVLSVCVEAQTVKCPLDASKFDDDSVVFKGVNDYFRTNPNSGSSLWFLKDVPTFTCASLRDPSSAYKPNTASVLMVDAKHPRGTPPNFDEGPSIQWTTNTSLSFKEYSGCDANTEAHFSSISLYNQPIVGAREA